MYNEWEWYKEMLYRTLVFFEKEKKDIDMSLYQFTATVYLETPVVQSRSEHIWEWKSEYSTPGTHFELEFVYDKYKKFSSVGGVICSFRIAGLVDERRWSSTRLTKSVDDESTRYRKQLLEENKIFTKLFIETCGIPKDLCQLICSYRIYCI